MLKNTFMNIVLVHLLDKLKSNIGITGLHRTLMKSIFPLNFQCLLFINMGDFLSYLLVFRHRMFALSTFFLHSVLHIWIQFSRLLVPTLKGYIYLQFLPIPTQNYWLLPLIEPKICWEVFGFFSFSAPKKDKDFSKWELKY